MKTDACKEMENSATINLWANEMVQLYAQLACETSELMRLAEQLDQYEIKENSYKHERTRRKMAKKARYCERIANAAKEQQRQFDTLDWMAK